VRVVIKPYSVFRDKLKGEVVLEFSGNEILVKDILEKLESLFSISSTRVKPIVIINDEVVDEKSVVRGEFVELHLVPPFSGG
jgi:cobyric acid synthase